MNRCGQASFFVAFVGMFLLALIVFGTGFINTLNATQQSTNAVNDLDRVAEAHAIGDLFYYSHVPIGTAYSVHQRTIELAEQGGGSEIEWSYEKMDAVPRNQFRTQIRDHLQSKSAGYFDENYASTASGFDCSLPSQLTFITQLTVSYPISDAVEDVPFQSIAAGIDVNCKFRGGKTTYRGGESVFTAQDSARDNRYFLLVKESIGFFSSLNQQWTSKVNSRYHQEDSACGYNPAPEMEREMVNNIEGDINSGYSNAVSPFPRVDGFVLETAGITGPSTSFRYTSTDLCKGSEDLDVDTSNCDCDEDGCETEYHVDLTIKPIRSNVDWVLKDEKFRVPNEEHDWTHLEFHVKPYKHNYQKDGS